MTTNNGRNNSDYEWSLNVLDAKVRDRKHWARRTGMVVIKLTDTGRKVLDTKDQRVTIFYGQGPLLAPLNRDGIIDYKTIASYETEIAKKGAPTGVMKGTTAMDEGRYGAGRVFCFSPHPEMTDGLETMIQHAVRSVARRRTIEAAQAPSTVNQVPVRNGQ